VAKRTAGEIYADLRAAGFSAPRAVVMTAIALAESGGDDTAVGDVGLENSTWGPSYGLFQVRTLKGDTGRGTDRDITALQASDAAQARAAYDISSGGTVLSPWTTYNNGAYQKFLGQAQAAANGATVATTEATGLAPTIGPSWLPWNLPSDAINAATTGTLGGIRAIVLEGLVVVLGVGLVGFGLARTLAPQIKTAARAAAKAGKVAAL
jgi:hypothetical protein